MLLILAVHISAICHVDTLIFLSPVNKGCNRCFSDLWVVSRGIGEKISFVCCKFAARVQLNCFC